jgi:hypothetical protein
VGWGEEVVQVALYIPLCVVRGHWESVVKEGWRAYNSASIIAHRDEVLTGIVWVSRHILALRSRLHYMPIRSLWHCKPVCIGQTYASLTYPQACERRSHGCATGIRFRD